MLEGFFALEKAAVTSLQALQTFFSLGNSFSASRMHRLLQPTALQEAGIFDT